MKKKEYFLGTNHQNRYRLLNTTDKAVAPHSSTLAWKIPWMEEPGGLQSMARLSLVALHGMAHCFTELDKAVAHVISLISFL